MEKRTVFVEPNGDCMIVGRIPEGVAPPIVLAGDGAKIQTRDRIIEFASLYRVTPVAAYYKEPMIPCSARTFTKDPRQV